MEFIINNIDMIIVAFVFIAGGAAAVIKFKNMSKEQIMGWLLYAVMLAEKEFGSGTGKLKLSAVYDKFCERFPRISKILSFSAFSKLVDESLVQMRDLLESNNAIATIIVSEQTQDQNK